MPEDNKVEIEKPVDTTGKVQFMTAAGFVNPPPVKLKRILGALRYFCVSLITTVGATDLFTGKQAKIICFILGAFYLLTGFVERATGVKPVEDDKP